MTRKRLTPEDYAAMAVAAEELAGMSTNPLRRRYNKALSASYRASSLRTAATVRAFNNITQEV